MVSVANIACKTAGIAGMSAIVYDAYAHAKHHSAVDAEELSADVFENAIAATRTNADASHVTGVMQKKLTNLRMHNPIIPVIGKIKGFVSGFFGSLADNIVPTVLSAIALGGRGFMQKAGAIGLVGYTLLKVAKEGFGLGKKSPIDE